MRIVSPLLKNLVYPLLSEGGVFHRTSASGIAIVTYHGVVPPGYEPVDAALDGNLVSADMLRRQLRLLKAHYDVIAPEDVLAWRQSGQKLPRRAVLLTCDDGLLNCLTDMLPVLQEENVKCLFFVTGASAEQSRSMLWYEELFLFFLKAPGGPFEVSSEGIVIQGRLDGREQRRAIWWESVKRLSRADHLRRRSFVHALGKHFKLEATKAFCDADSASGRRFGLLNCAELRQLALAGMSIGAHTLTHPMLSQLPPEQAYEEIAESRARLEAVVQGTVWAFAYPFGDPQSVTPQVLTMAQRAGYQAAFLNFGGGLGSDLPVFALPRIHVTAAMSLPEFEAHVCGFYTRLQRYAGRNSDTGMTHS
jgi:peptidoglycan/xylan/chitin deacetylase (PgdA/CDA1 family)